MTLHMHRAARHAIVAAIGLVAALAAVPASAQNPVQEEPCGVRGNDGPCRADLYSARPAPAAPATAQSRPWERLTATRLQEIAPTGAR